MYNQMKMDRKQMRKHKPATVRRKMRKSRRK